MTEETTAVETVSTVIWMVVTTVEDGVVVTAGLLNVVVGAVVVAEAVVVAVVMAGEEEVAVEVSLVAVAVAVVVAKAVVVPVVVGAVVVAVVEEEDVVGRPTAPERFRYSGRWMLDHSEGTRTPRQQFHLVGSRQTHPEGHHGVPSTLRNSSAAAPIPLPSTPTSPTWVATMRRRNPISKFSSISTCFSFSFFFSNG